MANTKISNLPAAASLTGSDLMPVVQSGVTKKGTFDQIPFLQAGTGAVARTAQAKMRERVSVKDFGAVGDGVTDDTAAIQAAITYGVSITQAAQVTVNGVLSSLVSAAPEIYFPVGRYVITSALNAPSYFYAKGEQAEIIQNNLANDIFYCLTAVRWHVDGITFIGGRHHAYVGNPNTDVTLYLFENCSFVLSQNYAIKTEAQGGVWTHMSANITVRKCIFDRPNKVLNNCCDNALIEDCWVFVDRLNFAANSAAILNRGTTGYPRLTLRNFFGVPAMGTGGTRLANVRWVDNYVGSVIATDSRFGGEDSGMPVVRQIGAAPTVYPWTGAEISIVRCWTYAGESTSTGSGVVYLDGAIPMKLTLSDNIGPVDVPFVVNPGGLTSSYFTTWESASGQAAYDYFRFLIRHNEATGPDGGLGLGRIPSILRPYLTNGPRQVVLSRTGQSIPNGFAPTAISWTNPPTSKNVSAWTSASPTLLSIPVGATRMRIDAGVQFPVGTATAAEVTLYKSGVAVAKQTIDCGAANVGGRISMCVSGVAGDSWEFALAHNSGAAVTITSADCTITVLDLVT